jgi:hypothetical protein
MKEFSGADQTGTNHPFFAVRKCYFYHTLNFMYIFISGLLGIQFLNAYSYLSAILLYVTFLLFKNNMIGKNLLENSITDINALKC